MEVSVKDVMMVMRRGLPLMTLVHVVRVEVLLVVVSQFHDDVTLFAWLVAFKLLPWFVDDAFTFFDGTTMDMDGGGNII